MVGVEDSKCDLGRTTFRTPAGLKSDATEERDNPEKSDEIAISRSFGGSFLFLGPPGPNACLRFCGA